MSSKSRLLDTSSLYTVQKEAIRLADNQPGFAFFMEMGLGKTRVVLYEFNAMAEAGLVDFLVVIAPRSLRGTWRTEAEELNYPYPVILTGKNAKADKDLMKAVKAEKGPTVVVMNYELVPGRGIELMRFLQSLGRVYCALDESIRIKKHDSVVGKILFDNFKEILRPADVKRVLSGRPAPQGPHDLWNQMRFIGLDVGSFFAFRNTYCKMGGWMGKKVTGAQNLSILRKKTGHRVFRAKKADWTDLPSKLPAVTREVEMLPVQRQAYLGMMHDFVTEWGDRHVTVEMAVTAKQKLAQIGTGFMYDNDGKIIWLVDFDKNPKLNDLDEFADGVETKIIIPYHHKPALEALKWWGDKRFAQEGERYAVLESGMKDDPIEYAKMLFNEDPSYKYIFIQSSAHKYGHTLLGIQPKLEDKSDGMPCHTMYFFENTYNLDTRLQTEDRDHRHGQQFPCSYADVAVSREDRLTIKALQRKERLEESLLQELTGVGNYVPEN